MKCSLIIFLLALGCFITAAGASAPAKRVLVLDSYHPEFIWTELLGEGFREVFEPEKARVEIYSEYLDSKRFGSLEQRRTRLRNLLSSYPADFFDAVVVSNDPALQALIEESPEALRDLPIVFCGINFLDQHDLLRLPRSTGVLEEVDVLGNIRLIQQLLPETERICIITDLSRTGRQDQARVKRDLEREPIEGVEIDLLVLESIKTLKQDLAAMGPNEVIFWLTGFQDAQGTYVPPEELSSTLKASGVPVFVGIDALFEFDVIGGNLLCGSDHGIEAARMVLDILFEGIAPDQIPIVVRHESQKLFHYDALRSAGIPLNRLPESAVVHGAPPNIFTMNPAVSIFVLVLIVLLAGFSIGVFINNRQLVQARNSLREREASFRLISEASPIGIFTTTEDGTINWINEKLQAILYGGSPPDKAALVGAPCHRVLCSEDDDQCPVWKKSILSKQDFHGQCQSINIHGDPRQYDLRTSPMHNHRNDCVGFVGTVEDVTDRARHEVELEHAKESAESASRAKSDFLAVMSHEFRTPLNSIVAPCDLLLETVQDSSSQELIEMIRSSAQHLLYLIERILDLARVERGRLTPKIEELSVRELVAIGIQPFAATAEQKHLQFEVQVEESIPDRIYSDSAMLVQVVNNLIGNALKFTAKGKVQVRLTLGGPIQGDRPDEQLDHKQSLRLEVEDSGVGVPKADIERIFAPFYQADMSMNRPHGGTGLGLAICREVASALNGEVYLADSSEQGSRFVFAIPLLEAEAIEASANANANGSSSEGSKRESSKDKAPELVLPQILVIDDDAGNLQVARQMLRKLDYAGDLASSGAKGLELFAQKRHPVVFMDIRMPGLDGEDTAVRLREIAGDTQPYIIAFTAFAQDEHRAEFIEAGMDDFVAKPVNLSGFRKAIERGLAYSGLTAG